ncbi:hypothetical protein PTT_09584, partial [Pyrenophora teres f. teres 0-1]
PGDSRPQGPPRHEKPPLAQPPALPTIPPAPSVEDSEEEEEEIHPNCFIDDPPIPALFSTLEVSSDDDNSDTGCASLFIDSSHARAHKYDLISLSQPATLELADGSLVAGVTHMARVTVKFGAHVEDVLAYVTKLSG